MRKKSIKNAAQDFSARTDRILAFLETRAEGASDEHISWLHDYAIIRLYREFEELILQVLVGAVNNDSSTFAAKKGIDFPVHMKWDMCEYLVTGGGYFNFKGRSGLIKRLKNCLEDGHYLVTAATKEAYKESLDRLSALRNFSAHNSIQSKKSALEATGQERMGSAGSWLKSNSRFQTIATNLKQLAAEIETAAPY